MKLPVTLKAPQDKAPLVALVAEHLVQLDPGGKGVQLQDFVASLYPAKKDDGLDAVRAAVATLTRAPEGKRPETIRVGRLFGRFKGEALPGGLQILSAAYDTSRNCQLWTASRNPDAAVVSEVSSGRETVKTARPRAVLDDPPDCRYRVERFVGGWLTDHRTTSLPGDPLPFDTVCAAGSDPSDVALRRGRFVLVVYCRDASTDPRIRMPAGLWQAIGQAKAGGAAPLVCLCNDEPGYMSFHPYDAYLPHDRVIDGSMVYWSVDPSSWWFGNFKQICPHIQALRYAVGTSAQTPLLPGMSRFLKMLLQTEPDLIAAVQRGWLLSHTAPEAGIATCWAQRCEIESAIDLYVCVHRNASGSLRNVPIASVRLDLCPAGLSFSEDQLQTTLDRVASLLSRTNPDIAHALSSRDRVTISGAGTQKGAVVVTPRVLAFPCAGQLAQQVGDLLYEHACGIRPKRLKL